MGVLIAYEMVQTSRPSLPHVIGRYALYGEIAAGGMATVHYGRLLGPAGFSRTVAIKRLHAQFAKDPEFVSMFLDEARLAARIRHPNAVQTLDVVALGGELFLVMDYVQGESLSRLVRASRTKDHAVPLPVVSAILCGALHGLHAAHEATNDRGEPLGIVHRDVSPQNILVGADGVPRVLDFGVAKAAGRIHTTREGQVKGKLAYMSPEQIVGRMLDRRSDVFAAGIVLWETLTLQRLFGGEDNEGAIINAVMSRPLQPPSAIKPGISDAVDAVCMRALEREVDARFQTAREMALALEAAEPIASPTRCADWVERLAHETLAQRAKAVARIENDSGSGQAPRITVPEPEVPVTSPSEAQAFAATSVEQAGSQVSSISVSTSALRKQLVPARARRAVVYPALLLVSGAIVASVLLLTKKGHQGDVSGSLPAASSVAAAAVIPPPPSSDVPATPSASAAIAVASGTAAAPTPSASSSSRSSAGAAARPPRRAPAAHPADKPCTIRSYVDDSGIEHFVKDCK
jgi:serine/threonine protein kinase